MSAAGTNLVSFDLDGTLFPDTTTCLELGRLLGHLDLISDLEARYARFEISNTDVAEQIAKAYRGQHIEEIEEAVLRLPLIGGFRDTIRALKQHDIRILIVTVTGSFAARALVREHGLDGYAGAELGTNRGQFTGRVDRHIQESDKPRFVQAYARQFGIDLFQCAAVGDSRSDIPLFREVGVAIALNASEEARAAATVCVDSDDLTAVLPYLLPA